MRSKYRLRDGETSIFFRNRSEPQKHQKQMLEPIRASQPETQGILGGTMKTLNHINALRVKAKFCGGRDPQRSTDSGPD